MKKLIRLLKTTIVRGLLFMAPFAVLLLPTAGSGPGELQAGNTDPRQSTRCRDTCPAAFHYLSTTGEDSWGLQGIHGDNELHLNPLPLFDLATKVVRRQRFSKRAG